MIKKFLSQQLIKLKTFNNKKIFICSTEQSGDNIGSGLMDKLLEIYPKISFDGVGGSKMSPYFDNKFYDISDFKSMGIFEIIFSIKKYIQMLNYLSNLIIDNNYDLVITIDSPDFNYPLAKKIKNKLFSKKIIHIVAPTVWAWRKNRAKKFANVYNEILVLFKFEKKYFERFGLRTSFIGHPIYYVNYNNKKIKNNSLENQYIAFLPGSRIHEVKTLIKFYDIAYNELLSLKPNINIFIPTLPHLKNFIKEKTINWKINTIIVINPLEMEKYYKNTKYSLTCSGTATLEISKRRIPQLVIYKFNFLTEFFIKFFIKVRFANLINIIEDRIVIPELVNSKLNKYSFKREFKKLILNDDLNTKQKNQIDISIRNFESDLPPYDKAASRVVNNF